MQDIGIQTGAVVDGATIQTVNARRLHAFLQSKAQFSNWIKDRIDQYGFVAEVDFTAIKENSLKGRPSTEYHISLGMAKEPAMVERIDKGRDSVDFKATVPIASGNSEAIKGASLTHGAALQLPSTSCRAGCVGRGV